MASDSQRKASIASCSLRTLAQRCAVTGRKGCASNRLICIRFKLQGPLVTAAWEKELQLMIGNLNAVEQKFEA